MATIRTEVATDKNINNNEREMCLVINQERESTFSQQASNYLKINRHMRERERSKRRKYMCVRVLVVISKGARLFSAQNKIAVVCVRSSTSSQEREN